MIARFVLLAAACVLWGRDLRSHGQEEPRAWWMHACVDLQLESEVLEAIRTMGRPSASRSAPLRRCAFPVSLVFARRAGICQSSFASPMRKERLDGEMKIIGEYGLKNKREAGLKEWSSGVVHWTSDIFILAFARWVAYSV